jgi:organic hydroperoxide reductase OsmC/OhrA
MAGHHTARVRWERNGGDFAGKRYSRVHRWTFDGGLTVLASASPDVVKAPYSDPSGVDPEEAFVASLASCHMLTFLWHAALAGFIVESYEDEADGVLAKNSAGQAAITQVTLKPMARFSGGKLPNAQELDHLHHLAHRDCFIANSVKTEIICEPKMAASEDAA